MTRRTAPDDPLFAAAGRALAAGRATLAERMRPERLADLLGQQSLLGAGRPLRREVEQRRLRSLLLWGPPGSGKTTLARLLAREAEHELLALSAVSAGVTDVRSAIESAEQRLLARGRPTLLFVDEIHRFHKGQQDALLHAVEDGRLVLIGATTENPSFHVNAALLSRLRVLKLAPLDVEAARTLLQRTLTDEVRGLGGRGLVLAPEAEAELLDGSNGDARRLLNALERASELALASDADVDEPPGAYSAGEAVAREGGSAEPRGARPAGPCVVQPAHVIAARGEAVHGHDKSGDRHFDLLSVLHKSLRGSDADAAAYWVLRLISAGEDPTVVARRLVRMASEDVGLADPRALRVALDALEAVQFLGLPEGDAALVQAAIYLALAPKSDAVYRATLAAREAVERLGALAVPLALRNAPTALLRETGAGRGYENPQRSAAGVTDREHLPAELAGRRFYEPGVRGGELELARRLELLRAARSAAAQDPARAAPPGPPGSAH